MADFVQENVQGISPCTGRIPSDRAAVRVEPAAASAHPFEIPAFCTHERALHVGRDFPDAEIHPNATARSASKGSPRMGALPAEPESNVLSRLPNLCRDMVPDCCHIPLRQRINIIGAHAVIHNLHDASPSTGHAVEPVDRPTTSACFICGSVADTPDIASVLRDPVGTHRCQLAPPNRSAMFSISRLP